MNSILPLLTAAALSSAAAQRLPDPPAPMASDTVPSANVEEGGLHLHAEFRFDAAKQALRVRYLLSNKGKQAVALFDRGDRLAVAQERLKAGTVAAPAKEQDKDGLTLLHHAVPLRKPAPTVPPVPLAARVAVGAELGGDVLVDVGTAPRLRYCLGVAPFEPDLFSARETIDGVEIWRASFDVVGKQKTLCTPWFDTATQAFVSK